MENNGRPKETIATLPDGWKDKILELYLEGASDVEVKAMIYEWRGSFSNDLWDRWMKEEEEFSETIRGGKLLSQVWWEKNGRQNLTNVRFNYSLWYKNMINRFRDDWREKQELDHTSKGESIVPVINIMPPNDNQSF